MAPTVVIEKDGLLPSVIPYNASSHRGSLSSLRGIALYIAIALACTCAALWTLDAPQFISDSSLGSITAAADLCPQSPAVSPVKHAELWQSLNKTYGEEPFMSRAIDWLGGAIRVP